ncbi:unnamed protein product [Rotaria sp. Silwood1]|nr:unnamed protein product [Rotaria sp. Silwood1]CAF3660053.1 unnamed protein product [Rotaria sp. Silwood1]CAF3694103.1 unnamed protein product [Rotaria sp. Silwood1]CAF3800482.1 unnamed protein product [Rotaria sp. Silwood1]
MLRIVRSPLSLLSSIGCFLVTFIRRIHHLWILPIIQLINMVIFEDLIGGGAYVNTFYKISIEIPEPDREFSMGGASIDDSFGITFAGLSAIPLHSAICR